MSLPNALIDYRQSKNITQKQLALEMGVNPATLVRIEKNVGSYTIRKILFWCKSNGVDPGKVFPPEASA